MMSGPTIDSTGFHVHEFAGVTGLQGWLDELVDQHKSTYGDDADLNPESPDGEWLTKEAQARNDAEQIALTLYNMNAPAGAVGTALSRLVQLNGISRKSAQFSTVNITLGGVASTVIPIDSLFDNPDDPDLPPFKTAAAYTIGGGGTVSGQGICTKAGPYNVGPGKLTRPLTVISGWNTVTNPVDAAPGRFVESDPILRVRRAESVAMPSQSMLDGLRAALNNLDGVDDVVVYENRKGYVDEKGHPPHSIHVIIDGGIAADIANAIWVKSGQGVTQVGAQSLVITDAQGEPQQMQWDLPGSVDVYITVQLSRTPTTNDVSQIKAALVSYGQETSRIGENVPWGDLFSPINALEITGGPGLPSITSLKLGSAPTPTLQQDLVVAFNERPHYDATRVLVVGP
jgi:uncharacterized phage protein gp47/JayE